MKLSDHFTLEELTHSETAAKDGIDNTPPEWAVQNLILLCENTLEPLRLIVNRPIHITSGYRSIPLNAAIGGSETSQHCRGQAADIRVDGYTTDELFYKIVKNVPFDQVIKEYAYRRGIVTEEWAHVSFNIAGCRGMTMEAKKENGKTVYKAVFIEPKG